MLTSLAFVGTLLTIYLFARDMGTKQLTSSRFNSFYRPFVAETVVQHEYLLPPKQIWKALTRFEDYRLWFPNIEHMMPVLKQARYVHRFSFDRFTFEPGSFIKLRPRTFLPWFKGRILGIEPEKKLELEMRFTPMNTEIVSFEINRISDKISEVICTRRSRGLFSFLATWGFANKGSSILHNLSHFIPEDLSQINLKTEPVASSSVSTLSRETIIAQSVQAGLDGNMDLINAIPDKPTRGMAKAALVKAKRVGKMPDALVEALKGGPVSSQDKAVVSDLPVFDNNDDLIAFVVNKALDGDMEPINSIPEKPLRGKAKAAVVKAKRAGDRPPMPDLPTKTVSPVKAESETEEDMMARLIEAGVQGYMDEINALDNKVLRGKIKAAVVKTKRANKH